MNIQTALIKATNILENNKIFSARLDAEILLSDVIEKDRKFIILNMEKILSANNILNFKNLITRRSKGEPVAYLINKKNFWNNEFIVSKDTLIPRPDTEIVVSEALKFLKKKNAMILDIGVGSGCILLSILNEEKNLHGIGIDISKKCLDICEINAKRLRLNNRVKFFKTDIDNFNYGKYDLVVSNPPYIKKNILKYLEKSIINFEPRVALDGGYNGTTVIKKVIDKTSKLIKKNGIFILEIAFDQKNDVKKLLSDKGFYINRTLKDYGNNFRCLISTKL
tara:strand:+ start:437 stop:1276 length:840 start_codon:yes stop_codon:yes gene_type:complete